ncbi:MAG: tetratricopeptide repeat protein [Ignavibacteria bacterium]|nr:tetratricopeptide repeat protein [Ignavibacteria bacterium]
MKNSKQILFLFSGVVLLIMGIIIWGCASAELTTGKLAFQQRDYEKAEINLKKGLEIDKNDAEGWYMLAVSQTELKKYDEARKSFEMAMKVSKAYEDERMEYWRIKFNECIKYFNSAVGKDSATTVNNLLISLDYAYAAIAVIPDSLETYRVAGDALYYLQNYDKAIEYYRIPYEKTKSKDDAINLVKTIYKKGLNLRLNEKYEESITTLKQVLQLQNVPQDNSYYEACILNIGINYYQQALIASKEEKEYKPYLNEAVVYFEKLLSSKDEKLLKDLYEYLYSTYQALGNEEKASEIMKLKEQMIKQ